MDNDKNDKKIRSDHYTVFQMYCENDVSKRFKRLKDKLASKNLMFKFDGVHYAIFVLDVEDMSKVTDYTLTLEQVEEFAEKV
jgi:hypothetical protein